MNKLIFLLLFVIGADSAFADCDFSTGIIPGPNKTFIYSRDCHLKVGELVQTTATQTKQISDLNQAITLKDLALDKADARTQMWSKTAEDEQDRLTKLSQEQGRSQWLAYGLGALTIVAAGWMTSKLINR